MTNSEAHGAVSYVEMVAECWTNSCSSGGDSHFSASPSWGLEYSVSAPNLVRSRIPEKQEEFLSSSLLF